MLALAGAVVVGCGSDSSGGGSSSAPSADAPKPTGEVKGELELWLVNTGSANEPFVDKKVKEFEADNPGTTIKVTRFGSEEYWTKTLAAFSAGNEPDVFFSYAGEELNKFVRTGKIADLKNLVDTSLYNEAALGQVEGPDGQLWGVPIGWQISALWTNPKILAENGVEAPKTWDDLLSMCKTLSGKGVTPLALGNGGQDQWTAAMIYDNLLYQYGGVDAPVKATYGVDGASWSDEPFVKAAEAFQALVDAGCFPKGYTGLNYDQMSSMFLRGDSAAIFNGTWIIGQATGEAGGEEGIELEVMPLPDAPGAQHSMSELEGLVGGVQALAASSEAADSKSALVAAFLDSFGAYVDEYANVSGLISVAKDAKPKGKETIAVTKLLADTGEVTKNTDVAVPAVIVSAFNQNLQAMTAKETTPEEFGQAMAEASERERANLPKLDQ